MIKVRFSTGDEVTFKPSFSNIAEIGDATELVEIFAKVHYHRLHAIAGTDYALHHDFIAGNYNKLASLIEMDALKEAYSAACLVLVCCTDEELTDLLGGYVMDGDKVRYKVGTEDPKSIVTLAQKVLIEGMIGHPTHKPTKKNRKSSAEFNVSEYVHMAVSDFGISVSEAWQLSMTEFISIWENRHPQTESEKFAGMTTDEYNAKAKAFAELKERHARRKANG